MTPKLLRIYQKLNISVVSGLSHRKTWKREHLFLLRRDSAFPRTGLRLWFEAVVWSVPGSSGYWEENLDLAKVRQGATVVPGGRTAVTCGSPAGCSTSGRSVLCISHQQALMHLFPCLSSLSNVESVFPFFLGLL